MVERVLVESVFSAAKDVVSGPTKGMPPPDVRSAPVYWRMQGPAALKTHIGATIAPLCA